MKNRRWMLIALPCTLAACGGEEAEPTADLSADSAMMTAPAADPGMGGMPSTLALQPVGDSGASGQATLTGVGAETQVSVQLTGLTPGEHPGHIHAGTCDAIGAVVTPLPTITAAADGAGSADTTVAFDAATVMNGQHIISYHGDGGAPVACGQITAHAM